MNVDLANLLLEILVGFSVFTTLLSSFFLYRLTRKRGSLPDHAPPVTILKPLKGVDEGLEENLRSFFRLDYPTYQLIFGVADADDPAIPIVRAVIAEFPDRDASLVIGARPFGMNPKVQNLASMYDYRKHDVILISDSNVRVRPSYLRETACYLADPSIGLVTNLFAGEGEERFGAAVENLQLNGYIAAGIASAASIGITCVVGKSMLLPVRALEAAGGFAGVRNLLAEDQVLGVRVRKAGYSIKLSGHVVGTVNRTRGLKWFLNRHSRWYKMRRRLALPTFLLEPTANLATVGMLWAFSGDSWLGWVGLVGLVGLGAARDALHTKRLRGSFPKAKYLLLSPVKDLFLLPVWFDALINDRLMWRGNRRVIGRFTRLRADRPSRSARRRARTLKALRARPSDERLPRSETSEA